MKLILFDIDGTLLHARGAGRRIVAEAFDAVSGIKIETDGVAFAGRTDTSIVADIASRNGLQPDNGRTVDRVLDVYTRLIEEWITPDRVHLLPGVAGLVRRLRDRTDVQLGLLTGNIERVAYLKLRAVSLADSFPFGAFGSDHHDRHELPAVALERARLHIGRSFEARQVTIVGDTEHDISCSRAGGLRAVGVCTGTYSREQLAEHEPDLLLDDLQDHDAFLEFVDEP